MSIHKVEEAGHQTLNSHLYYIDTDEDVALLPKAPITSQAVSLASGKLFVVNGYKDWQEFGKPYTPRPEPGDETLPVVGTGTADHAVLTE